MPHRPSSSKKSTLPQKPDAPQKPTPHFLCRLGLCQAGDWQFEPLDKAACQEVRRCRHCQSIVSQRPHTHHYFSEWKFTPSGCQQTRTCQRCGRAELKKDAHEWEEWKVVKVDGVLKEERQCKHCRKNEERCLHIWKYAYHNEQKHRRACQQCGASELENHRLSYSSTVSDDYYHCDLCGM